MAVYDGGEHEKQSSHSIDSADQHPGKHTFGKHSTQLHDLGSHGHSNNAAHLTEVFGELNEVMLVEQLDSDLAYNEHATDPSHFYIIFLVSIIFTKNDGISWTCPQVSKEEFLGQVLFSNPHPILEFLSTP